MKSSLLKTFLLFFFLAPGWVFAGPPSLAVSPAKYDFGTSLIEASFKTSIFTISNTGGADLAITGISVEDRRNFSLDLDAGTKPCGMAPVLAPGEICTFAVAFHPKKGGPLTTGISISANARVPSPAVILAGFGGICEC